MSTANAGVSDRARRMRRLVSRHRRAIAGALAALAVALGTSAAQAPTPHGVPVVVATRDLPTGAVLGAGDLATVHLPATARPDGSFASTGPLSGRTLSGPLRRHEPLTDARLAGPGVLTGLPAGLELVAAPVTLADEAATDYVAAGDRVDVLATPTDGASPSRVVASGAVVLAVRRGVSGTLGTATVLMVGTTRGVAADLARAGVTSRLSVTVLRR